MIVRISAGGAVRCWAALDLPLSATAAWGQLRDFHRYARQDMFHAELEIEGKLPRPGAKLAITHRYAGFRVQRNGRILIWREGVGYSFSDLSRRGGRSGFPHVLSYRIAKCDERTWRLEIEVRGKWTASRIPKWMARVWLWWVFGQIVRNVDNELLRFRVWRRKRRAKYTAD
jgi:hypothetical protein